MITTTKTIEFQSFLFRLALQVLVYYSKLNPIIKILLLFTLDVVDGFYISIIKQRQVKLAKNEVYQKYDKINDLIAYYLALLIIKNNKLISSNKQSILKVLLFIRFIAVGLYCYTNNQEYLYYIPDLFKETLLVLYFVKDKKKSIILFILVTIFKLFVEYWMHVKKYGLSKLLE
jgi:hypothetical protein